MLLPLLLLPWAWGAFASSPPLPPASLLLRLLQSTLVPNASASRTEGTALLGDLETHAWDCGTGRLRFLQPWARRGLTPQQWQDLVALVCSYIADFVRLQNEMAQEAGRGYPFVVQFSTGCEQPPNGIARPFCDAAMDGQDWVSFAVDTGRWVVRRQDPLARRTAEVLNYNRVVAVMLQFLLGSTCPQELRSFVQHGNASLERRERPVAVVFVREPPPAEPPMPWLLVCRVTGFYPRAVRVAWLQDGEEVEPGWRLNSSGILPNADLTYQLRSSLAVGPGDGHSYACRVQHSSLGGRSLLIPWERSRHWGPGLAVGIALGALALAVGLWWRRRRGYQEVGAGQSRA
ncbi:antigen-presenting glycoprotein CD1d-like isoform X2 [Pelodiscus sinensis]|uniref:antigen-presenting glycoprotein CD1d-like isoform X2 n=1 Tax=Pelodiscus sinensis TaxID=13735 RepID=UPI003F6BB770